MNIFIRIFSFLLSLIFTLNGAGILGQVAPNNPAADSTLGAKANAGLTPWQDEISKNSAKAAQVTVPPLIRVANADYSLDNQALTASDCTTIQTSLIDYSAREMKDYDTTVSVTVPSGASAPTLNITTQGLGNILVEEKNQTSNPYTWEITGGSAMAGNFIEYTISYNLEGKTYTQKAASYIDFVELAAGWQTHVVRRNFFDVTHTRHEYTATLSGSASTGPGFGIYGHSGEGFYKMELGGGGGGYVSNPTEYSGIKAWMPGYDNRENASIWYCGQSGKRPGSSPGLFEDNIDGGHRAMLDIYYDPYHVGNVSDLGLKLLYWRSTSPTKIPTLYQDKMIYKTGDALFSDGDDSDTLAKQYFQATNANNDRSQYIDSNPGTLIFDFDSFQLPPDGQQVTFANGIYGNFEQQVHLTTWTAWLITFHVMDKADLRALIQSEDTAFRQVHDGYSDSNGAFSDYLNKLSKAKSVLNQPNASTQQIEDAKDELLAAINNLDYAPADYSQIDNLVSTIYMDPGLYRPSPILDPEHYYFGTNYYPAEFYNDISPVQNLLDSIVYGLDSRYATYLGDLYNQLNTAWRNIELLEVDYSNIISYIDKASGLNDSTGSAAGNFIYANSTTYPDYEGRAIYWRHFTTESYNSWDTAVNNVVMGLKIPDKDQVLTIESNLRDAYNALTIMSADYTLLNATKTLALATIDQVVEIENPEGTGRTTNLYTNQSRNLVIGKIDSFTNDVLLPDQVIVDDWASELSLMLNNLNYNDADYRYANIQKEKPSAYESNPTYYYTADSWQALLDARAAVVSGKLTDEQATVNAWAQNIYEARNALELNRADYSGVDAAIAQAQGLNPADYTNWSLVENAIASVVYDLDIFKQTTVNGYALAINNAIEGLLIVPISFATVSGSGIVRDFDNRFLYGLPADGSLEDLQAQGYLSITGPGHFEYDSQGPLGTGSKVALVRDLDSLTFQTYEIVIFGDLNGDGLTDGTDAVIANLLVSGMLTEEDVGQAVYFAADVNGDGVVDQTDIDFLELAGLFLSEIDQRASDD
ncbi:MAG: hypothetical protein GX345_06445 [Clostridiales bacterium]|nr:hypothetical protein [Clostridiales bacterium]